VGGYCEYKETRGIAIITKIVDVPFEQGTLCNDKLVRVIFDFTPYSRNKMEYSNKDKESDTILKELLIKQGAKVGSKYRTIRKEIITGACSPVSYSLIGLDFVKWRESFERWNRYCWFIKP